MTYLTESRDALAKALAEHAYQDDTAPVGKWAAQCRCGWLGRADDPYSLRAKHDAHRVRALIASGAVIPADTLADDAALVMSVAGRARDYDHEVDEKHAHAALRALSAALTERGDQR